MNHSTPQPPATGAAHRRSAAACWVEAMRLRTLPVSVAGVIMASALTILSHTFKWLPALICLTFAILAQIASNFANEYFDFRDGLDRKGRTGPRRGVTEGDITPKAMLAATLGTLALAALCGCTLLWWGNWLLIPAGIAIVLGALAYSAGPYPLSRHGWGEVAVVLFFGIAPVTLTYWLQAAACPHTVWLTAAATGLMGANVLIVNNYRDMSEDAAVGKLTLAVRFGARFATTLYLVNGIAAMALMLPLWLHIPAAAWIPALYLFLHFTLWQKLRTRSGAALTPLLGMTAMLMLMLSALMLAVAIPFSL